MKRRLDLDELPPAKTLHEGDWLRLVRRGHWEYAERTHGNGMAVIIAALTPDDRVLFVEQPRIPLAARSIEMPAGLVGDQPGEDTLEDAARRELVEETGWEPARGRRVAGGGGGGGGGRQVAGGGPRRSAGRGGGRSRPVGGGWMRPGPGGGHASPPGGRDAGTGGCGQSGMVPGQAVCMVVT